MTANLGQAVAAFRDATASPDDVPRLLRLVAQRCFEDAGELESAWQDSEAGRPWTLIGRELEKCADRIEKVTGGAS